MFKSRSVCGGGNILGSVTYGKYLRGSVNSVEIYNTVWFFKNQKLGLEVDYKGAHKGILGVTKSFLCLDCDGGHKFYKFFSNPQNCSLKR